SSRALHKREQLYVAQQALEWALDPLSSSLKNQARRFSLLTSRQPPSGAQAGAADISVAAGIAGDSPMPHVRIGGTRRGQRGAHPPRGRAFRMAKRTQSVVCVNITPLFAPPEPLMDAGW